jgi:hypothetical protein
MDGGGLGGDLSRYLGLAGAERAVVAFVPVLGPGGG